MNAQIRNEIIRRWYGGQSIRGVARQMKLARKTVKAVLEQHEAERQQGAVPAELKAPRARRASLIDPHLETIQELLSRYPKITVQRIWEELRDRGYTGGYSILCERVGQLRPRPQTPWVERFETGPGVQAQMDYAVYTLDFTQEGRRRVNLFSLILSYSRRQYLRFVEAQDMETTQRQHILAFQHLGGVAATCLYDCMKVVVSRHERFPPTVTHQDRQLAAHRPPRDQQRRRELLKQRYAQLGEGAGKFLDGLLQSQRNGWQQAEKVLALLATYRPADFQAALERAVRYGAFSLSAVQRILAVQAQPKSCLEQLAEQATQQLPDTLRTPATPPRPPADYQPLLLPEIESHDEPPPAPTPAPTPTAGQAEQDGPAPRSDEPDTEGDAHQPA